MRKITWLTSIIAISMTLCSGMLLAQSGKMITLTLKDAVFLALRNNPTIESSELARITQKYDVVVAQWAFEPQYTLTSSLSYTSSQSSNVGSNTSSFNLQPGASLETKYGTKFSISSTNPITNQEYNPSIMFKVEQPLIRGFGRAIVEATLNNALDTEKQNKLELKSTIISTVNTIMTDYFNLISAKENLKVSQASLKSYEQTVANDQIKIKVGSIAKNDIYQDEAHVAAAKATIQSDLNTINQNRNKLLYDIGLSPEANIAIPDKIDFDGLAARLKGGKNLPPLKLCKQLAIANNTDFQTTGIGLRILRRELLVAKDNTRWQLDLTASETMGGGSGSGPDSGFPSLTNHRNHAESIGAELTVPIDDVNEKQALINARVSLDQAQVAYANARRQLEIDITNNRNAIIIDKHQLDEAIQAWKLQEQTVHFGRLKHDAGRISSFELLILQQDLTSVQQSVISSMITYLTDLANFDQALGITLDLWNIKIRY